MFHCTAVYLGFAKIRIIQNFIAVNTETDSTKRIQLTIGISCRRSGCCGSPALPSSRSGRCVSPPATSPAMSECGRSHFRMRTSPVTVRVFLNPENVLKGIPA